MNNLKVKEKVHRISQEKKRLNSQTPASLAEDLCFKQNAK